MSVSSQLFNEKNYLYRVRKLKNDLSDIPSLIQDVWYPKSEYVKSDGRANRAGNPMLYCSLDQVTPIHECGIEENEWYAMIQYNIKPGYKLQTYAVGIEGIPDGLDKKGEINVMVIYIRL